MQCVCNTSHTSAGHAQLRAHGPPDRPTRRRQKHWTTARGRQRPHHVIKSWLGPEEKHENTELYHHWGCITTHPVAVCWHRDAALRVHEGIFKIWNAGMRYRYHNSNGGRVSGGASEADKGRYTAVLAADGLGRPAPGAFIVRVKPTTKHDMSKCRAVQAIGAKLGWPARLWEREINGTVHKRWVAQDPVTGAFVTSHSTAWMDTTGMVMYAELVGAIGTPCC